MVGAPNSLLCVGLFIIFALQPFLKPFPFDVISIILECIDLETAKAAALVSRDFFIIWRHWPCVLRLSDTDLKAATRFLSGPGRNIRRLDIYMEDNLRASDSDIRNMVETISRCTNLKRFFITSNYRSDLVASALGGLDSFASRLKHYASTFDGREGVAFFTLHQHLTTLQIYSDHASTLFAAPLDFSTPFQHLSRVALTSISQLPMLQDSPVTDITLLIQGVDSPSTVLAGIRKGSLPVERVALDLAPGRRNITWYKGLIACLPSIRFLNISEDWPGGYNAQEDVLASLPCLEDLVIAWIIDETFEDSPEAGRPWEIALSLTRCSALKHLELTLTDGHSIPAGLEYHRKTPAQGWTYITAIDAPRVSLSIKLHIMLTLTESITAYPGYLLLVLWPQPFYHGVP